MSKRSKTRRIIALVTALTMALSLFVPMSVVAAMSAQEAWQAVLDSDYVSHRDNRGESTMLSATSDGILAARRGEGSHRHNNGVALDVAAIRSAADGAGDITIHISAPAAGDGHAIITQGLATNIVVPIEDGTAVLEIDAGAGISIPGWLWEGIEPALNWLVLAAEHSGQYWDYTVTAIYVDDVHIFDFLGLDVAAAGAADDNGADDTAADVGIPAGEVYELGAFTYEHNWAPGWNTDGIDDEVFPLQMETLVRATHLVVEFDAAFADADASVSVVSGGSEGGWWNQVDDIFSPEQGLVMVIDLHNDIPTWAELVTGDVARLLIGLNDAEDLVSRAYLILGDAAPVVTPPVVVPPAAPTQNVLRLVLDSTTYTLNGVAGILEVAPYSDAGRTMVPFRFIGEAMNAEVTHTNANAAAGTPLIAHFVLGDVSLDLPMGETIVLDGVDMGTPEIVNGRTLVPVRYVAVMMGAEVDWDATARAVTITFGGAADQPVVEDVVEEEEEEDEDDEPADDDEEDEPADDDDDADDDDGEPAASGDAPTGNVFRGELNNRDASVQFTASLVAGNNYTLTFWFRNAAGNANVQVEYSHWPDITDEIGLTASAADTWVFHEMPFTAVEGGTLIQIAPEWETRRAGHAFYISDVVITAADGTEQVIGNSDLRGHWDSSVIDTGIVPAP